MSGVNITVFDTSGEEPKEVASWQTAEDGTHTPTEEVPERRRMTSAMPFGRVMAEVLDERLAQDAKWGEQNHPDWSHYMATTATGALARNRCQRAFAAGLGSWAHVLDEEVGEAFDEARAGNVPALRRELVQVAAVSSAWVECIDRHADGSRSFAVERPELIPRPSHPDAVPTVIDVDGRWLVCFGHLEVRLFLTLAVAHRAALHGLSDAGDLVRAPALVGAVQHVHALELHAVRVLDQAPVEPGDWYVTWENVDEDTEGAVPVTVLDLEAVV